MKVALPLLLFAVLGLSASPAWSLPDLARGKAALARGDLLMAEENLLPLAERGFVEAQLAVGRMYIAEGTPESMDKAQRWYRRAIKSEPEARISLARLLLQNVETSDPLEIESLLLDAQEASQPDALALRVRLYRSYPHKFNSVSAAKFAERAADSRRADDRAEAISWYRVHSDVPAYASALATLCEQDKNLQEDCLADLARHYRLNNRREDVAALRKEVREKFAAGKISNDALERFAQVLAADELPGEADPKGAYKLLALIEAPTSETQARVAKLLISYPELDSSRDPDTLLRRAYEQGSFEAAMLLGRRYLKPTNPNADPIRAQALLSEAADHVPAAHYFLGRFYERGYEGTVEATRALEHYLQAARQGYSRADLALSKMYSNNRGIKLDPVNAHVFARLAAHYQVEGAVEQLVEVQQSLSEQQLAEAQLKAEQEFDARRSPHPFMATAQNEQTGTQ